MAEVLKLSNVSFYYETINERIMILENINYSFEDGQLYVIMGPSGSGKTTLLSLLGALDEPKAGEILFDGKNLKDIGYSAYRNKDVGFVFQSHNLLKYLNVIQNVEAVMEISGCRQKKIKKDAAYYLEKVEIDSGKFPRDIKKLSGGEQQRVAIARAIAMDTKIVLADEPTGNLDRKTGLEIIKVFQKLAHEDGKCVVVATHSEVFAESADVTLRLLDKNLIAY